MPYRPFDIKRDKDRQDCECSDDPNFHPEKTRTGMYVFNVEMTKYGIRYNASTPRECADYQYIYCRVPIRKGDGEYEKLILYARDSLAKYKQSHENTSCQHCIVGNFAKCEMFSELEQVIKWEPNGGATDGHEPCES